MKIKFKLHLLVLTTLFFFSACSEDEIYPVANFKTRGFVPGFKWKLDASSAVAFNGQKLKYRWDYDGDQSNFDTPWLTNPLFTTVMKDSVSPFIRIVSLQVQDEDGRIGEFAELVYENSLSRSFDTLSCEYLNIKYFNRYLTNQYRYVASISKYCVDYWIMQNVVYPSSQNSTNMDDALKNGTYLNWNIADTLKAYNYHTPTKEEWTRTIQLFFGMDLAGYNLQVNNKYSLKLNLNGYVKDRQIFEKGVKGYYWTSTEVDDQNAWAVEISQNSDSVRFVSLPKNFQCKVRLSINKIY